MGQDFDSVIAEWREAMDSTDHSVQRAAGDAFERLCAVWLEHDPMVGKQFCDVEPYMQWATRHGLSAIEPGIDLVAGLTDGSGEAAIQCKLRTGAGTIKKQEIDSFLAASSTGDFVRRIIIDTTGRDWSSIAEDELRRQQPPVTRFGIHDLRNSHLDWSDFKTDATPHVKPPAELYQHQSVAVERITRGLKEKHSRGMAIMACGTGKTLVGLRTAEYLAGVDGRVLCLVPSLALMSQTITAWMVDAKVPLRAFAVCSDSQVGKRRRVQDDNIDMDVLDLAWPATTNATTLAERASTAAPEAMTVVFATYQSSNVIETAQQELGLPDFDLVVCDEAHRTAGAILKDEEPSDFARIHDQGRIICDRRLYMTATPKIYAESARTRAGEFAADLCSMDDESTFGTVLYHLGFADAVEKDLLSDYRVIVLTVPESHAARLLARSGGDLQEGLTIDDTALMIGCWRALAKVDRDEFPETEQEPMRRAIAFCSKIKTSVQVQDLFARVAEDYREHEGDLPQHSAPARHVDGTMNASKRAAHLAWLDDPGDGECRVLTNARCLTEGVDVPALDGILFMHPRKSQIEVVQAVGRVMRKARGKRMGYIVLPVVIADGADANAVLNQHDRWRKVWQMLNAIRSHDERLEGEINLISDDGATPHISLVVMSDWKPAPTPSDSVFGGGGGGNDVDIDPLPQTEHHGSLFEDLPGAIRAKIVEKCGNRRYWEDWAGDVGRIARAHIERITAMVTPPEEGVATGDQEAAAGLFVEFLDELRALLNPAVKREEAIEMLAQHLVTGPVFDALFGADGAVAHNPVGKAMQTMLDAVRPSGIDVETEELGDFYDSVRRRVEGASTARERQTIVRELYDKFFRTAFPKTSEELGIVYTPVELVDFILHSANDVLKDEFDAELDDNGVHILDPFTGTGTFISRLIHSGMIGRQALQHKYADEIHANELVLLAYYIASVNIETAFLDETGEYQPFDGICLIDTYQTLEDSDYAGKGSLLADITSRIEQQKKQDIRVIVGNPPWNVAKKGYAYPRLYHSIDETYAAATSVTNKNSLYDSYKLAIRWASNRIGSKGIIAFVTNASWLDGNADAGIRACMVKEFSSVHVLNLRGNQRTQGELSRREGGKMFGSGSRAPVAVMVLVKNPSHKQAGCRIRYHDIGDYLTREEKLEKVTGWGSISSIPDDQWRDILPTAHNDWLNPREKGFLSLPALGDRHAKAGDQSTTIFQLFNNGWQTGKDAYLYNFDPGACAKNAGRMIDAYCAALSELGPKPSDAAATAAATRNNKGVYWGSELLRHLRRKRQISFSIDYIRRTPYRPFVKQHCYTEDLLAKRPAVRSQLFPTTDPGNRAICLPGIGSTKPFSALMVDAMPDLHFLAFGQCFPRYRFEEPDAAQDGDMFVAKADEAQPALQKIDNITDWALHLFQTHYRDHNITKDDIFDYVYGVVHAPDFRAAFPNALAKELPRVPLAPDFQAFATAGRDLAELHLNYETGPEHALEWQFTGDGAPMGKDFRLGPSPMRWAGKRGSQDRSVLEVNDNIRLLGIPDEAHCYEVNGRTPLEWLIDRWKVSRDKKSEIVNDVNDWFDQPDDIIPAIKRVVHVSVRTVRIVSALPPCLTQRDANRKS